MITIVSGLPRSGTSMMMQMLEAGGMQLLVDGIRKADEDNPGGYYEYEKVKQIRRDVSWLDDAEGKAVKVVYSLLYDLPTNRDYKVIFMKRKMAEVLASQRKMLRRKGRQANAVSNPGLGEVFESQIGKIESWLAKQARIGTIYVSYNDVICHPEENARRIGKFLDGKLVIQEMINVVDIALYTQRK